MYKELKEFVDEARKVVFFGGAGVSTESGIPDFRSKDGLYHAEQSYGYPPETILSHTFYVNHTETFFKYYKENLICEGVEPNKAHLALAELERRGKLNAVITQNIDGLHQKAGSVNVLELHGSVLRNTCEKCGEHYSLDYIMDEANCEHGVPYCKVCGGRVKPDVVLYEETLDNDVMINSIDAIQAADVMIVGGTSLNVYPAAGLISYFRGKHLVLVNRSATPYDDAADLVIHDTIGKVLWQLVEEN
jgi:NAD-dependent deacetylase